MRNLDFKACGPNREIAQLALPGSLVTVHRTTEHGRVCATITVSVYAVGMAEGVCVGAAGETWPAVLERAEARLCEMSGRAFMIYHRAAPEAQVAA
jgi:hypothetical protein